MDAADPDLVRASIGHAIAFATWQSLAIDQGLGDARAARLLENFVTMAADASRDQTTS